MLKIQIAHRRGKRPPKPERTAVGRAGAARPRMDGRARHGVIHDAIRVSD
jgi:hypothetical protein